MSSDFEPVMLDMLLKRLADVHEQIAAQSIICGAILGALSIESPMVVEQVMDALDSVVRESASPVLKAYLIGFMDGINDAR